LTAQERVKNSYLSKRELISRLGLSQAQFYGLLDQTNYEKSIDQLIALLTLKWPKEAEASYAAN
jgi:hypothetical protein